MVTECGGPDFFTVVQTWATLMVPVALFACLWRVCVTSRSPNVIGLGLSDDNEVFAPLATKQIETSTVFLYLLVSLSTFIIGVLTFKLFQVVDAIAVALKALPPK